MFRNVEGKIGTMRKSVEWTVYPATSPNIRQIQCDKRIAHVNLSTGKVVVSDGKGGHPGAWKLQPEQGGKEYDCPQTILDQLKNLEEDHGVQSGPVLITGQSVLARK